VTAVPVAGADYLKGSEATRSWVQRRSTVGTKVIKDHS